VEFNYLDRLKPAETEKKPALTEVISGDVANAVAFSDANRKMLL
jgi:hypothetical protein